MIGSSTARTALGARPPGRGARAGSRSPGRSVRAGAMPPAALVRAAAPPKAIRHLPAQTLLLPALALVVSLCAPDRLSAQRTATDTVTVEYRALMTPDATQAEVRRRALEGALAEAVRRTGGVRVQSGTLFTREERQGTVRDDFVSVVQLEAHGRVVDFDVLDEDWLSTRQAEIGPQVYLRLRLRATVARETGEPDAAFRVNLWLNAGTLIARSERLVDNDELVATVSSTQDARLTLVSIADDSVTVLFPNSYIAEAPLRAGESHSFPTLEWRNSGLRLRATLPPGLASRREVVMAVAVRGDVAPFKGSTTLDLQRWLVSIPLDRRAIASTVVDVRRSP